MHMFLSFGINGILRKQLEISVPKNHKLIMLILKLIRSFAKMTPTVVRQLHKAVLPPWAHSVPEHPWNPGTLQTAPMHLLRNPSERRMYRDLLHFKGQIWNRSSQWTDVLSAAISIPQVISGSFSQWGHQGETVLFQGGSIWTHHLSYCSGTQGSS